MNYFQTRKTIFGGRIMDALEIQGETTLQDANLREKSGADIDWIIGALLMILVMDLLPKSRQTQQKIIRLMSDGSDLVIMGYFRCLYAHQLG